MADLYSQPFRSSLKRPAHEMTGSNTPSNPSPFSSNNPSGMLYPQLLSSAHHQSTLPQNSSSDNLNHHEDPETPPGSSKSPQQDCKMETKPQATFLTKLYALLERPENHHMIRWDPQGEHIIVERPEQLALHVLPSIYRQSRFASFSRQLNIYGFMRKVNLRNIDPAIDDPDASTWSHPTLNRNSPPDVVANFKRRVPPRLPKPRKRGDITDNSNSGPRSTSIQAGPAVPPTVPSSVSIPSSKGRARGFSAPGSFTPLPSNNASPWTNGGNGFTRSALPPLSVSSELSHPQSSVYHRTSLQNLQPLPQEDHHVLQQQHQQQQQQHQQSYNHHHLGRDSPSSSMFMPHTYTYPESNSNTNWYLPPLNTTPVTNSGSLSSLLNPTSGLSRGGVTPSSTHSSGSNYPSPFSSVPMSTSHSSSSLSPDSRPTTGYSVASSMSSLPYDPDGPFEYRPRSGSGRPITPGSSGGGANRPKSSAGLSSSSLSVRRSRRHSQAVSPYPSPYSSYDPVRPLTAPDGTNGLPRVRSLMTISPGSDSSSGQYHDFNPAHADFAYSAHGPTGHGQGLDMDPSWMSTGGSLASTNGHSISPASALSPGQSGMGGMGQHGNMGQNTNAAGSLRPSTSTSSLSGQSSTSATHTPPILENFAESDINRFFP